VTDERPRKVVRSYRVVFRRRWRIFRVQGWRVPVPGGVELRAIGYWLACLAVLGLLARLPLFGALTGLLPPSLRLVALPLAAAWALSRAEVDGRSPHRALAGLLAWRLRPRSLAGLRRCPPPGSVLAPPGPLWLGPDFGAPSYPRGRLYGPARVLCALALPGAGDPRPRPPTCRRRAGRAVGCRPPLAAASGGRGSASRRSDTRDSRWVHRDLRGRW
jgi:hypothetical protein